MLFNKIFTVFFLILFSINLIASVHVHGYSKRSGTYVMPHYRTNPNHSRYDNWSTKGNVNPYTGKKGYKAPYSSHY
jgi:hypothetical protein